MARDTASRRWAAYNPACWAASPSWPPRCDVDVDLDQLEALAKAATAQRFPGHPRTQWMAAADPTTVLALIEQVRADRADAEKWRHAVRRSNELAVELGITHEVSSGLGSTPEATTTP